MCTSAGVYYMLRKVPGLSAVSVPPLSPDQGGPHCQDLHPPALPRRQDTASSGPITAEDTAVAHDTFGWLCVEQSSDVRASSGLGCRGHGRASLLLMVSWSSRVHFDPSLMVLN